MAAAAAVALGRAEVLDIARLALKANRVSDLLVLVNIMAEMHFEFNSEERSLLVIAYKHTFSAKRKELRVIYALEEGGQDDDDDPAVIFYRGLLEDGMQATCRETLDIVDKHLLPFSSDAENTALYTKMKADTYWILAMLKEEEDKKLLVDKALTAYKAASKVAKMLSAAHPLRLAVNLTETAFYFDVMKWPELATDLAKLALDKAGPELASLDEESYKESAEIMGLMEDNLKLWNPTSPKSQDYSEPSAENNIPFSRLASSWLEAGPSYSNGGSLSPPPPSSPVVPRSADYSEDENNTSFTVALLEAGPSYSNGGSSSPPPPSTPVVPRSADYSEDENNTSFMVALLEAEPSYSNGGSPSPPPPSPPVVPRSADYSEDENNTSFTVALLEAGPSYSNGGSPSPPPPSPPVVPRSADYSEDENNASFTVALLEAGPSYFNGGSRSPPPVVPLSAGPPVAPNEFINPGDRGYEFHEGLSQREIRFRKKAAQIKRGRMG